MEVDRRWTVLGRYVPPGGATQVAPSAASLEALCGKFVSSRNPDFGKTIQAAGADRPCSSLRPLDEGCN